MSLIDRIKAAKTKDQLEQIGIEELGTDIDRRRNIKVLKAELINKAEELATDEPAPAEVAEPEPEEQPEAKAEVAAAPQPAAPERKAERNPNKPRLMRHRVTGRVLIWTAALAKNPNFEEV